MNAEEITYWFKVLEVGLISGVKFLLAPFEAERQGFNFMQSFTITTLGGVLGVLVFYYAGSLIAAWWNHIKALIKSIFIRRPAEVIERQPKRHFTRTNKMIVKIKRRFGLAGIAFVTPCIISIPVGTLVAVAFYRKRKPILLYLFVSLLLWSIVLNYTAQQLALSQYMPEALHE
jgi:hypothetical protein